MKNPEYEKADDKELQNLAHCYGKEDNCLLSPDRVSALRPDKDGGRTYGTLPNEGSKYYRRPEYWNAYFWLNLN